MKTEKSVKIRSDFVWDNFIIGLFIVIFPLGLWKILDIIIWIIKHVRII